MSTTDYWVQALGMAKHPEGGWFSEVYRSQEIIDEAALSPRYGSARCISTSIYFLLDSAECSTIHRLKSDEVWHFYQGSPLLVHKIDTKGRYSTILLGPDFEADQHFQTTIPRDTWFGAQVVNPDSFALIGCTVAPGFEFSDFELGARDKLSRLFPAHRDVITMLTR